MCGGDNCISFHPVCLLVCEQVVQVVEGNLNGRKERELSRSSIHPSIHPIIIKEEEVVNNT